MKAKTFTEKWDREEENTQHNLKKAQISWKKYIKWFLLFIVMIVISVFLQKVL